MPLKVTFSSVHIDFVSYYCLTTPHHFMKLLIYVRSQIILKMDLFINQKEIGTLPDIFISLVGLIFSFFYTVIHYQKMLNYW